MPANFQISNIQFSLHALHCLTSCKRFLVSLCKLCTFNFFKLVLICAILVTNYCISVVCISTVEQHNCTRETSHSFTSLPEIIITFDCIKWNTSVRPNAAAVIECTMQSKSTREKVGGGGQKQDVPSTSKSRGDMSTHGSTPMQVPAVHSGATRSAPSPTPKVVTWVCQQSGFRLNTTNGCAKPNMRKLLLLCCQA